MSYEYEIEAHIVPEYDIVARDISEIELQTDSGFVYPEYEGAYVIDPALTEQTLPTKNKSLIDNVKVNPIFPNYGDASTDILTKNQGVEILAGWWTGGIIKIADSEKAKLKSTNILDGVTILGSTGAPNNKDTTIAEDGAAANDISQGKKGWINGSLVTGTRKIPIVDDTTDGELYIYCAETSGEGT